MQSTEARIIDIREWRAARDRAPAQSSNAPLVIVIVALSIAGLMASAAPRSAFSPTVEPIQWDGGHP